MEDTETGVPEMPQCISIKEELAFLRELDKEIEEARRTGGKVKKESILKFYKVCAKVGHLGRLYLY